MNLFAKRRILKEKLEKDDIRKVLEQYTLRKAVKESREDFAFTLKEKIMMGLGTSALSLMDILKAVNSPKNTTRSLSMREGIDYSKTTLTGVQEVEPRVINPYIATIAQAGTNLLTMINLGYAFSEVKAVYNTYKDYNEKPLKKWGFWKKVIKAGLYTLPVIASELISNKYGMKNKTTSMPETFINEKGETVTNLLDGTITTPDYLNKFIISLIGLGATSIITGYEMKRNPMKDWDKVYEKITTGLIKKIETETDDNKKEELEDLLGETLCLEHTCLEAFQDERSISAFITDYLKGNATEPTEDAFKPYFEAGKEIYELTNSLTDYQNIIKESLKKYLEL